MKTERTENRSDHEAACPQVFAPTPKPIVQATAAPKKSKKSKKKEDVEDVVAEEVVEAEVVEDVDSDDDSES